LEISLYLFGSVEILKGTKALTIGTIYWTLHAQMGNGSCVFNLLRNIGGSIGISTAQTFLVRRTNFHEVQLAADLPRSGYLFQQQVQQTGVYLGRQLGPAAGRPGALGLIYRNLERQALLLWFQGMSKASVGRRMSISENTVRQYISRARAKYAATGRTAPSKDALLARAIEDGVIKPGEIMPYQSFARAAADRSSLGVPDQ